MDSSDDPDGFSEKQRDIQRIQSAYRARLLEEWAIPEGARVLEIGCGQGDMTALLAEAVGKAGRVVAVDAAPPTYGAPLTLGQATDIIRRSQVGPRIDFRFNYDLLKASNGFQRDSFDYVVMVHAAWYFTSQEQLALTLRRVRYWAKNLCFVEWDMTPRFNQLAHLLAVLIQGQVEAFKAQSEANVRTPLSRERLTEIIKTNGWNPTRIVSVGMGMEPEEGSDWDFENLQDADWEIQMTLDHAIAEARRLSMPEKLLHLLESQVDILKQIALPEGNRPLEPFLLTADRSVPSSI